MKLGEKLKLSNSSIIERKYDVRKSYLINVDGKLWDKSNNMLFFPVNFPLGVVINLKGKIR